MPSRDRHTGRPCRPARRPGHVEHDLDEIFAAVSAVVALGAERRDAGPGARARAHHAALDRGGVGRRVGAAARSGTLLAGHAHPGALPRADGAGPDDHAADGRQQARMAPRPHRRRPLGRAGRSNPVRNARRVARRPADGRSRAGDRCVERIVHRPVRPLRRRLERGAARRPAHPGIGASRDRRLGRRARLARRRGGHGGGPARVHRGGSASRDHGAAPPGAGRGEDHLRHRGDARHERRARAALLDARRVSARALAARRHPHVSAWRARRSPRARPCSGCATSASSPTPPIPAPSPHRCRTAAAYGRSPRSRASGLRTSTPARGRCSAVSRARARAPTWCVRSWKASPGAVARSTTRSAPTRRTQRRHRCAPTAARRAMTSFSRPRPTRSGCPSSAPRCSTPPRSARPTSPASPPASGPGRTTCATPGGCERVFEPLLGDDERADRLARWKRHVATARSTEDGS